MIFQPPDLGTDDIAVIGLINDLRVKLNFYVTQNQARWTGFLRRNTFARAMQGSNSIEGINANLAEVIDIIDDEKPDSIEEETSKALFSYRTSMTYIIRTHNDPYFEINAQLIRSLHYMMLNYDLTKMPGQWRPGPIYVIREENGERVYQGPDSDLVPELMLELVDQINDRAISDPVVRAAMAHLNLAMIHPFKDGNGRMARALQTLVLAREGILSPVFCSIEEWLGRNTQSYYSILSEVGRGTWNPQNNALPWIKFCLIAHYQQAQTILKRNDEIGNTWNEIERICNAFGFPERAQGALMDAAFGYRVKNHKYREENEISDVVASRDLKKLCDVGLLDPVGEKRGRYYRASKDLREVRSKFRDAKKAPNPYDLIKAV